MSTGGFHVARDCAVLPTSNGAVIYKGETERSFNVKPHVGRWLVQGAPDNSVAITKEETSTLLDLGVIVDGSVPSTFSPNRLAPTGLAGWLLIGMLTATGVTVWLKVLPEVHHIQNAILLPLLRKPTTWILVPFVGTGLTLAHEWGHILVLRALGGRAGRLLFRSGWPWAVTEVGPFQTVLAPWKRLLLVAGGMCVEAVLLGYALAGLQTFSMQPPLAALVITTGIYLTFDLVPTPWSDGGQLLAILFHYVVTFIGRRMGHD